MQYPSYSEQDPHLNYAPNYVLVFTRRTLNALLSNSARQGAEVKLDFGADGAPQCKAVGHGWREGDNLFVASVTVDGEEQRQEWDFQLLRDKATQYASLLN
jgi:hypothetical protein